MLEPKCGGGRSNRDAAALQKTDADQIANGDLYGVACVYLTAERRDRDGLWVPV
jgi:hypothetical protein